MDAGWHGEDHALIIAMWRDDDALYKKCIITSQDSDRLQLAKTFAIGQYHNAA